MVPTVIGILILITCVVIYLIWQRLQDRAPTEEHHDINTGPERDEDDDSPLISFVLLRKNEKYLEDVLLTKIIQSAWGGNYTTQGDLSETTIEEGTGFVIGESPLFIIQASHGIYLIHNHTRPYFEDMEELLPKIHDLRLRKAVADHDAWLSVDLIGDGQDIDAEPDPAEFYPHIAKLIVELADEETLGIFQPDTSEINIWSNEVAEKMLSPDAYETFSEETNVPVIEIADDDPDLVASIEKARETWPEFVAAFQEKGRGCTNFGVKAEMTFEDEKEYIWLDVIGLEPRYVHGTLANDPVALGDLKLGSQVEVPLEDVQDWCYLKNGEPVGLYSLAAVQKAHERLANE